MLEKMIKWLLGDKMTSSAVGLAIGAATGVVAASTTGDMSNKTLIIGAIGGALSAIAGAGGRGTGEK